jgi:hypothetical protein
LCNGRFGAKLEQHARQGKEKYKAIQARNGFKGQHLATRSPVTTKNQGKEWKGNAQDI